jgi:hypothetical protein
MPAFRGKNLRSGDIAEQLGMLLLQTYALVAPVPRTEDVGIDAVVTLLRDFDAKRLLAEDSFFVQIKSASVRSISLRKEDIEWLYALDLPFFVASVERKTTSVKLFCAHRLNDAFLTNHKRESLTLILDESASGDELVPREDQDVHIGPPVLEWSLNTSSEQENFAETFYAVAKEHVVLSKANIQTRLIGWADHFSWKTNEMPFRLGSKAVASRPADENLSNAADAMAPYFMIWQQEVLRTGRWEEAQSLFSLLEKTRDVIKSGILQRLAEPDQSDSQ